MNLIHTLSLSAKSAQVSFAAPLTFNKDINAGRLIYNDLFSIYPYENQLFVVRLTGDEIRKCLEYSYDSWINTDVPGGHVLKIAEGEDQRTGQKNWHFINRPYNFDSAGGLVYTVDVTRPYGSRVSITTLADGTPFSMDAWYNVAMTSYRAAGGGYILSKGAGIDTDNMDDRIVARHDDIRNILYDYIQKSNGIHSAEINDTQRIGHWEFVPAPAARAIDKDMTLLFGE